LTSTVDHLSDEEREELLDEEEDEEVTAESVAAIKRSQNWTWEENFVFLGLV